MSEHAHRQVVDGCYRCELGADEVDTPARPVAAQTAGVEVVAEEVWHERPCRLVGDQSLRYCGGCSCPAHPLVRLSDAEALAARRVREALGSTLTDARAAVKHGAIWRGTPDNIETVDKDEALHYAAALIDAIDHLDGPTT